MRIAPVTGDLPAVAALPPPGRPGADLPPPAAPLSVTAPSATRTGTDASDSRARQTPSPFFDPPLIAQRAVLGLPIGFLVADFARSEGISWAQVSAAVDREMPPDAGQD